MTKWLLMVKRYSEEVPESLSGQRVDRIVALVTDLSRSEVANLIDSGLVLVDGQVPQKPSVKLSAGSLLEVEVPEPEHGINPDASVELDVVYSDEHVIVINKPPGLIVHPGAGVTSGTLVQGLLAQFPEIAEVGDPDRPGIVHRLDKGTSGLLSVARSDVGYQSLGAQLRDHSMERRYVTLVWGDLENGEGVIDAPLGRSNRQPMRRAVVTEGKPARTWYQVLQRLEDPKLTLLACRLETGRTHQIRVHLEAIGNPVVGDDRYGRGGGGVRETFGLQRPFLHAQTLGFDHPVTGEPLRFQTPLPNDLVDLITTLGGEVPPLDAGEGV
jgi:23S rRNA pseudouridine1911/1915/1917 synthase